MLPNEVKNIDDAIAFIKTIFSEYYDQSFYPGELPMDAKAFDELQISTDITPMQKDYISEWWSHLNYVRTVREEVYVNHTHIGIGQRIRDFLHLWWYPHNSEEDLPAKKPALVKYFNELGIGHADDMSKIIFTSFARKMKGQELELEAQIQDIKNYWIQHGIADGIYMPKNNHPKSKAEAV